MNQREILGLETIEIPEHFMFGMIPMKHLVGEIGTGAGEVRRELYSGHPADLFDTNGQPFMTDEDLQKPSDLVFIGPFIQGDPERVVVVPPQIEPLLVSSGQDLLRPFLGQSNPQRIENLFGPRVESELTKSRSERDR